jgi:integrase/recombinase XerD
MDGLTKTQGTITGFEEFHLETWLEGFLVDRKAQNLARGTLTYYRKKLRLFADYCEGQVITDVMQVTPDVLRRYLLWLEETGHNPGGVHACYRAVRAFFLWFWAEVEPAHKNPISKVKAPRMAQEPLDPVDTDTIRALLNTCKTDFQGVRDRAVMLTLLDTGARAQELLDLNLDDLDQVTGAVDVRQGKGRKPRTVYIGQKTRKAVRNYLKARKDTASALWVTEGGERLTYWGLRSIVTRRAKLAKVKPPSLHAFRRAFAIAMLRAGVDVYSLQELMGHADLQVLRRYLKQTNDDLRRAHKMGSPVDGM